jgi:hypothetical protein
MKISIVLVGILLALTNAAFAAGDAGLSEADIKARAVMTSVVDRYQGESRISSMSLITCEYKVVGGRVACSSQKRKKVLQSFVKNSGEGLKDSKGFTHIVEPVADRGISVLQYDYEDGGRDTDQWLYLPDLQKVKRIASDGSAPKKGSLFGSEFALEDVERPKIDEYTFKLLEEKTANESHLLVIEQIPSEKRAPRTNYSKCILWVDAEKRLVVKIEYYAWDQRLIKVRQAGDIKQLDGIWTIGKEVMRNLETQRISELAFLHVEYNQPINDEMLTQRMLVDPVFRESMLKQITLTSLH